MTNETEPKMTQEQVKVKCPFVLKKDGFEYCDVAWCLNYRNYPTLGCKSNGIIQAELVDDGLIKKEDVIKDLEEIYNIAKPDSGYGTQAMIRCAITKYKGGE